MLGISKSKGWGCLRWKKLNEKDFFFLIERIQICIELHLLHFTQTNLKQ
jgi:hypothetical protein